MSDIDIMSILDDYAAELDVHNDVPETQRDILVEISRILLDIDNIELAYWNQ